MEDVLMPSLGENVKEAIVVNVLIKSADIIEKGQTLIEVETDKVTFEVPCEVSGQAMEVLVKKGDVVQPGNVILKLQGVAVEQLAASQNSVLHIAAGSSLQEVSEGRPTGTKVSDRAENYPDKKNGRSLETGNKKIRSTPLARKLARELGIDMSDIGTEVNTRISFSDVKAFTKNRIQEQFRNAHRQIGFDIPSLPDFEKFGNVSRQAMSGIMMATARNMTLSASSIPHAWVEEKVDITDIESRRRKHKANVEKAGGTLTLTAVVISGVAKALKEFPHLNASVDTERNEIIFKEYVHIGVAVDTTRGLLVPVLRDVAKQSLTEIAVELTRISKEVKEGKAKLEDLDGGTFTISNLGGIGTTRINPLVNWPQVAILGLSASQMEPVWIDNAFMPRLKLPVTLGFDHRVINGADAARFLQYLKHLLEDHFLLLL